ncbi:MAG: transketolase family protein [Candidatus Omnitrophica bacterium]|nr:transketolase family protein [Candidatus Omnitrophota bacterium]
MKPKASRAAFGEAIEELGAKNTNIVVLDADLRESTKTGAFAKKFPERAFEFGIAEANMIGAGVGLALAGKVPFVCSFACFITGRFDQIKVSLCYSRAAVHVIGTHGGIAVGADGYSQQGLEDLALMRSLPHMLVLQPADEIETKAATQYLTSHKGPSYMRLTRHNLHPVNKDSYRFIPGKGVILSEGKDVTLVASGGTVKPALDAAEALAQAGKSAQVINIHTLKPIDTELLAEAARKTRRLVTIEDHTIYGGLGGAVAEALSETNPVPIKRIGLTDFGESGETDELLEKHGLSSRRIADQVLEFLKRLV